MNFYAFFPQFKKIIQFSFFKSMKKIQNKIIYFAIVHFYSLYDRPTDSEHTEPMFFNLVSQVYEMGIK